MYGDIVLSPDTTLAILHMLIFPSAISAMVTSLIFHKKKVRNTAPFRSSGTIQGVYNKIRRRAHYYVQYFSILLYNDDQ